METGIYLSTELKNKYAKEMSLNAFCLLIEINERLTRYSDYANHYITELTFLNYTIKEARDFFITKYSCTSSYEPILSILDLKTCAVVDWGVDVLTGLNELERYRFLKIDGDQIFIKFLSLREHIENELNAYSTSVSDRNSFNNFINKVVECTKLTGHRTKLNNLFRATYLGNQNRQNEFINQLSCIDFSSYSKDDILHKIKLLKAQVNK